MKTVVLLPAAVLAVLGAFAQPCYRQTVELGGAVATRPLLVDLAYTAAINPTVHVDAPLERSQQILAAACADGAPGALAFDFTASSAACTRLAVCDFVFIAHAQRQLPGLQTDQIRDLYSGRIANWRQLGGPDAPIRLLHADSRLQREINDLCGLPANASIAAQVCGSDVRCERLVGGDPFAIGCLSAKVAETAVRQGAAITVLALDGRLPGGRTAAASWPLHRDLFVVHSPRADSATVAVLHWLRSPAAAAVLRRHGYELAADS